MPIATPGAFTGSPATGYTLCEQLGRLWDARSTWTPAGLAAGLVFAEPDASTAANLYAGPVPVLSQRLPVAASIECDDSQQGVGEPVRQFTVTVECHARTPREAVAMGADLVRHLLDRDGEGRFWWDEPVDRDGIDLRGAVGFPDLAAGQHVALWRILTVQVAGGPRWIPQVGSTLRSADGQALAVVTLIITAVPLEWIEPE